MHDNVDVALVVTQPDRPAGRGRKLTPPPVKTAAIDLGLPVLQPESLRDDDTLRTLRAIQPDVLIVVAYGELLRQNVLDLAPHGCLNVHPSRLPRYRGAAPIPTAILHGDQTTGVSIMKLVRRLDAGPIVAQFEVDITPDDTTASLGDRLATLAAQRLPDVALRYVAGELVPRPQDEDHATYTYEWSTADAKINWSNTAPVIERLVRAATPWPVAWTVDGDTRLRILSASIDVPGTPQQQPAGTATMTDGQVVVATGDGPLALDQVQPAGKRAMSAVDWWRGSRRTTAMLGGDTGAV